MTILLDHRTRIIVQGITGATGRSIAERMAAGGGRLVGGVTPGRAGQTVAGTPVFESCHEAVKQTGANASFIAVPAARSLDACLEALDAGIRIATLYTENVPLADALVLSRYAASLGATILGPNAAGCVVPGIANLSDLNEAYLKPGSIGVVTKSGAISYEVIALLQAAGYGVSTAVCLGGDPVLATNFADILAAFRDDRDTRAVVMVGEIGGRTETASSDTARLGKPLVAHILGRAAPPGKRMGHAGAMLSSQEESAAFKCAALRDAGALIAESLFDIPRLIRESIGSADGVSLA